MIFIVEDVAGHDDLKEFNLNLRTVSDLEEIRMIARDRSKSKWKQTFTFRSL